MMQAGRPLVGLAAVAAAFAVACVGACRPAGDADKKGAAIRAVVSIAPLKGIVEPLLPPGSSVIVLVPVGVSEHDYEIPAAKLASLTKADLVVSVGLGLDSAVERFLDAN